MVRDTHVHDKIFMKKRVKRINQQQVDLLLRDHKTAWALWRSAKGTVSYNTVNQFITGLKYPSIESLEAICKAANITLEDFFAVDTPINPS